MLTRKRFTKSYSRKKTKKIIQVGAADPDPKQIETAIKKRITYFGDNITGQELAIILPNLEKINLVQPILQSMPSLFTTLKQLVVAPPDIKPIVDNFAFTEGSNKNINTYIENSIKLNKDIGDKFKDADFIKDNTYLGIVDLHGCIDYDTTYRYVPPVTIICFLSSVDQLTLMASSKQGCTPHFLDVLNNLSTDQYISLFQNREKLGDELLTTGSEEVIYNCFNSSAWYYPGQIYPDLSLSVSSKDINTSNEYSFQFRYVEINNGLLSTFLGLSSNSEPISKPAYLKDHTPGFVGDTNDDYLQDNFHVGSKDELSEICKKSSNGKARTKLHRFVEYERHDTLKKYRIIIVTSCRPIYNRDTMPDILQLELLNTTINQTINNKYDSTYNKPKNKIQTCCNYASYKQFLCEIDKIEKFASLDFENYNINFNGFVPTLIKISEKIHRSPMDHLEAMFISSMSPKKLLSFLIKTRELSGNVETFKKNVITPLLQDKIFLFLRKTMRMYAKSVEQMIGTKIELQTKRGVFHFIEKDLCDIIELLNQNKISNFIYEYIQSIVNFKLQDVTSTVRNMNLEMVTSLGDEEFRRIKKLKIYPLSSNLDLDFYNLQKFPDLISLYLENMNITNLDYLPKLQHLNIIDDFLINGNYRDTQLYRLLKNTPALKTLVYQGKSRDLLLVSLVLNLESLSLSKFNKVKLNCPSVNLKNIYLDNITDFKSTHPIKYIESIELNYIKQCEIKVTKIENLIITSCHSYAISLIYPNSPNKKLETTVKKLKMEETIISKLEINTSTVEEIEINLGYVTSDSQFFSQSFPKLKKLLITGCYLFPPTVSEIKINRTNFPSLEILYLDKVGPTIKLTSDLFNLPILKEVSVCQENLQDTLDQYITTDKNLNLLN